MNKDLIDRLKAQGDFIDFKMSPQFHANRERHGDAEDYCIVCGKAVKHVRHGLRVFYGSSAVTEAGAAAIREEEGGGGDLGFWPIGSDCLRNNPELRPFIIKG